MSKTRRVPFPEGEGTFKIYKDERGWWFYFSAEAYETVVRALYGGGRGCSLSKVCTGSLETFRMPEIILLATCLNYIAGIQEYLNGEDS